jgi:flagellar biosynthesis protein FliQ
MVDLVAISSVSTEALRTLLIIVVPTLAVPLVALIVAVGQGMLAIREESLQYGVRVLAVVGILAVFGVQMTEAMLQLMRLALQ